MHLFLVGLKLRLAQYTGLFNFHQITLYVYLFILKVLLFSFFFPSIILYFTVACLFILGSNHQIHHTTH